MLLREEPPSIFAPDHDGILNTPGIEKVIPIGAGVSTVGVDGDSIWVMAALSNQLHHIDATTGSILETYTIDSYVEGVIPGGGFVWLLSYDNDGEVLRFNPGSGTVDLVIPIEGSPWHRSAWFDDRLWVSNDQGELFTITADGDLTPAGPGSVKGQAMGYLWVANPTTGDITSLSEDGTYGAVVIPRGVDTSIIDEKGNPVDLFDAFSLTEAGGYIWLMTGEDPASRTTLLRFDPSDGELLPLVIGPGLHGMVEHDGHLWVISYVDHLLIRVDPDTRETSRYPMPGKTGGITVADGSIWLDFFHPGLLARVDTRANLIEAGETLVDQVDTDHRLLCTGPDNFTGPIIILEPPQWIGPGSWSVIQAELSNQGSQVCAHGYLGGEPADQTPSDRATDLASALDSAGISGPLLLVTAGDGVHATRLFAEGRDNVVGILMVDPVPVGWDEFLTSVIVAAGEDPDGAPEGADLDAAVSAGLGDFGATPLVVIGQDPDAVFLNDPFVDTYGDGAYAANRFWHDGLVFYAGLSTDSRTVVADGTGMHMVVWDRADLVVDEVLALLERIEG
jgi:hypothetical protein